MCTRLCHAGGARSCIVPGCVLRKLTYFTGVLGIRGLSANLDELAVAGSNYVLVFAES